MRLVVPERMGSLDPRIIHTHYAEIHCITTDLHAAERISPQVDEGVENICSHLNLSPPERIIVQLSDRRSIPVTLRKQQTIIIPLSRLPDCSAIVHELTHLIVGVGAEPGGLLDEGLAVYLQAKFGGANDRSFPTEGKDVHEAASNAVNRHGSVLPLDGTIGVRRRGKRGPERTLAYLQEGSFTGFLIESFGVDRVMSAYKKTSWQNVFNQSIGSLEAAWHRHLRAFFGMQL